MFIRKKIVHSKRTGIRYAYYQLLESRNTEKGPRNTVLLHLGRLDISNEEQNFSACIFGSSLGEFFKIVKPGLFKDSLYRIADKILEQKDGIERRLRDNLKSLHALVDQVYLYDLTNTYFEGNKFNSELCKRGKSKEKRSDCPLVTLALVVDQKWRNTVKDFRDEFHDLSGFEQTIDKHESKLYLKKVTQSEDLAKVLVYSEAKSLKERGITSQREKRFLEEAEKLISSCRCGYIKDSD